MATTPATHPDIYRFIAGGEVSPVPCTVTGAERKHKWEVKSASGTSGEYVANKGQAVARPVVTFYLADLEDVEAWEKFQRLLETSVEGPKPKALFCFHPELLRNKIMDLVVEEIGAFVHDGKNGATVTVKFIEYKPPKPKPVVKPDAGKKASSTPANDPNAARKAELAALLEQAKQP